MRVYVNDRGCCVENVEVVGPVLCVVARRGADDGSARTTAQDGNIAKKKSMLASMVRNSHGEACILAGGEEGSARFANMGALGLRT